MLAHVELRAGRLRFLPVARSSDLIFDQQLRVRREAGDFVVCAERDSKRLIIYEESGAERRELASVTVSEGPDQVAAFFQALRRAVGTSSRDTLRGDTVPLEPFQPPPDE